MTSFLRPGRHVWLWAHNGFHNVDAPGVAADCQALGLVGALPHLSLESPAWCERWLHTFMGAGVDVTASLGMDGGHTPRAIADAIKHGLHATVRCMMDWESPKVWESKHGRAIANEIASRVLGRDEHGNDAFPGESHVADADTRVTDCPWPQPLTHIDTGKPTHPGAPFKEFGRLATGDVYVQAYATEDDRSTALLAWARSAGQYPKLGRPAEHVRAAHNLYRRTQWDQVNTYTREQTVIIWDYSQLDEDSRNALLAVARLEALGWVAAFAGEAVREFQKLAGGLTVDNKCGPKTFAALMDASAPHYSPPAPVLELDALGSFPRVVGNDVETSGTSRAVDLSANKAGLLEQCSVHGITVPEHATKAELIELLRHFAEGGT